MNKELDAYTMLLANKEAQTKGEKLPYTKQQFNETNEGNTSSLIFDWNLSLPTAEQFTKLEHSEGRHCNAIAMVHWNIDLPHAEPYTKKEHSEAKGCTAETMRFWNECLPEAEPYTKEEHASAEGCTAEAKSLWNLVVSKSEQYTKMEMITNKTVTK